MLEKITFDFRKQDQYPHQKTKNLSIDELLRLFAQIHTSDGKELETFEGIINATLICLPIWTLVVLVILL